MTILFTIFSPFPYIKLPQDLLGWTGMILMLGVILLLLWRWRTFNRPWKYYHWMLFLLLAAITPLTSLFIGIRFPIGQALPPPGIPIDSTESIVMIFAALPWALAAGLLGPTPAALLAAFAGTFLGLWDTHSLFTPLEYALLATLFSAAVRQSYRTPLFQIIRHPLATALLLAFLYPLIHLATTLFTTQGLFVSQLDYAMTNLVRMSLGPGIALVVAGLITEIVALAVPGFWGDQRPLEPAPAERSLQNRLLYSMAPLALILVSVLVISDWFIAGQAAKRILAARMADTAQLAASNVPYFMETGQNLISNLASNPKLQSSDPAELSTILSEDIKIVPFFDQLMLLDENGTPITSYPTSDHSGFYTPVDEQVGIQLALDNAIPFQTFTVPPTSEQTTAQVSFVATILDENQEKVNRILIGRSSLGNNPFTKPVLASLDRLAGSDGQGMLVDENGRILVHHDPEMVMTTYTGPTSDESSFFESTAPDGTRDLVYYQPAEGRPWAIILTIPASRAQQLAIDIAAPLLAIILLLSVFAVIVLVFGLRFITASLKNLAAEAGRISQGHLNYPLQVEGEDEVGQLRRAFEQMRVSLKDRLNELNSLLLVSQGVASTLEVSEAVQPVLESAVGRGVSAARVVLTPTVVPELEGAPSEPVSFGLGPSQDLYQDLDEQILAYTRQHERLVQSDISRPRLLSTLPGAPKPASILAVALRHENSYYGSFWVAYDEEHQYTEEEVRFMVMLAGQAALAAANTHLFLNAEIGRQRLAAILASSPDPMLVIDQRDRLLLANPAAWHALDLGITKKADRLVDEIITQNDLLDLLRTSQAEKHSKEIMLPNERIYLATVTPVLAEGQRVGRVCILQDVTHFKELDSLKSEFVSTVSHDLRSPLTLMRGYATMLEMVGQLNEQQINYVRKIITGVESMSRLVNNLLDLGRIEAGIGLQLETIPVRDIVENVVGGMQLQAAQKRIQLTTVLPQQSTPMVEADQALLQQALQNLVENAIKYTRPDGKVKVSVQAKPIGMVFEVIDNGIGISPMDQPRVFEKFYRGAQGGSTEQRGTGLGLAIVKSIAERHGGKVWAESQLGKGSAFYLSIPFRQHKPTFDSTELHDEPLGTMPGKPQQM